MKAVIKSVLNSSVIEEKIQRAVVLKVYSSIIGYFMIKAPWN